MAATAAMYHSALNSSSVVAAQVAKAAAVAAAASSVPYSYNNSHLHHHHHPMFSIPHVPGGVTSAVVNSASLQNLPHLNAMSNEYGQLNYKEAKFYQTDFLTEYEKR
jgi:hypothetical protein